MIKTKSNLLIFDKLDKIDYLFPKECVVTIPDVIPIVNFNSDGFDCIEPIGYVTFCDRNNFRIAIETEINLKDEELLKKLIKDGKVYSSGNYEINEAHAQNSVLVPDNIELKSVGLRFDDVYGDDDLKMEVLEND